MLGLLLGVLVVADIAGIVYAVVYKVPKPKPQPKWFASPFFILVSTHHFFMRFIALSLQQRSLQPEQLALLRGAQGQPPLLRCGLVLHVLQRCPAGVLRQLHHGPAGVSQEELDCCRHVLNRRHTHIAFQPHLMKDHHLLPSPFFFLNVPVVIVIIIIIHSKQHHFGKSDTEETEEEREINYDGGEG